MKPALIAILVVATAGLVFSGYLSYGELFAAEPVGQCTPIGEPGGVLGAPPCIYGFFMYLAITVMAVVGLARARART